MRYWVPLLCFLWLLLCVPSSAQNLEGGEADEIETDRDSFTRSPRVVAPGRVVLEGSYTFIDQPAEFEGHLFPDLLARVGLTDWFELRGGWTYEIGKFHHLAPAGADLEEEGLAIYGGKAYLTDACGIRPDSALIVTGYTPTSGESNDTDVAIEYVFGWALPNRLELDGQIQWFSLVEGEDHFTTWAPSVVLKAPMGGDFAKAHVEYFSILSAGREENYQQHYVGPGIHFLLSPDFEIGVRMFWGAGEDSADYLCNVGLGVRF